MIHRKKTKSNHFHSPEYCSWNEMKRRCFNVNCKDYCRYGGRGITVCVQWCESFEQFLKDVGKKPTPDHSLDRIDVNGHYEPKNCRWATPKEQGNNRRKNVKLSYNGKTKTQSEWARELNIKVSTICYRLKFGWSIKDALSIPVQIQKKSKI